MPRRPEGWRLTLDERSGIYGVRWRHCGQRYHRTTGHKDPNLAAEEAAAIYAEAVTVARKKRGDGAIYFVQAGGDGGLVKIGFASNLTGRLASMRTDSSVPLAVLGSHAGTMADEKAIHRLFSEHRHRGEWFRPAPAILDYVQRHAHG